MAVLLLTFKIFGYTLLFLVALLFVILILPFHIRVRYKKKELSVILSVLLIPIKVYPIKKTEKKEKKERKEKKNSTKELSKPNIGKELILALLPSIKKFLKQLSHAILFRGLLIRLVIAKEDPKDTGILTGRLYTGLVLMEKILSRFISIRVKKISVIPDFMMQYDDKCEIDCKVVVIPCILILAALQLLIQVMKYMKPKKISKTK